MLKGLFAAAALVAMATGASAATVEFRGAMCITSVTAQCASDGWNVGDCLTMRYSPPNLGTNGAGTDISFLNSSFGVNFGLTSGTLVGATMKPVAGVHVGRTGYTFASTMRLASQTAVSASAPFVSMTGFISNFDSTTGCTVGFRASGARQP